MHQNEHSIFIEEIYRVFLEGDPNAATEKQQEAENVRALQRHLECLFSGVEKGDFGPFAETLSPDVTYVLDEASSLPVGGGFSGRAAVVEHVQTNFGMIRDQSWELLSVIAQGDQVVLVLLEQGWCIAAEAKYSGEAVQLYTLRDGLVCRFQMFE